MKRASRLFTTEDQRWFADVSGDNNPLHMDAAWASRTFPGQQVVHGMHVVLWALDTHFAAHPGRALRGVRATFVKPIVVGDEVDLDSSRPEGLRLLVRGEPMALVQLQAPDASGSSLTAVVARPISQAPEDLSRQALAGFADAIVLSQSTARLSERFPVLSSVIGASALSGLAGVSTIVGMECPGLHSVLSEFSVRFSNEERDPVLAFQVRRHDPVFSRVEMQLRGSGLTGTVAAFAGRPDPEPAGDETIRGLVEPDQFKGQRPLIIGASSGLGLMTARILAAGGAEPVLTWRGSPASLETAVAAVTAMGGRCAGVPFDVSDPAAGIAALAGVGWEGREVYFFASPRIFRRRIEAYQAGDLQDFLQVYVDGCYQTVRGLLRLRNGAPLRVFYPSSTALDESVPELFEYTLAKAAGEQLCERLQEKYRALSIVSVRLPRIATRQTKTSIKVRAEQPETVMAPIIRRVQGEG